MLQNCDYCVDRGGKVFGHYDQMDQKYFDYCLKKSVNDRKMPDMIFVSNFFFQFLTSIKLDSKLL